jgi:hypothetical protein
MQATNDAQIRGLLLPFIRQEHESSSDTLVIEEFAIYGGSNRADVAALNGISHGYEIKSDRDTLSRLPNQVDAYGAVFEFATLVSTARHLPAARRLIPKWWGIVEVKKRVSNDYHLERVRESRLNPKPHAEAIAALLWKPEALRLLALLGIDNGVRSKSMDYLTARLAQEVKVDRLAAYVREALRARGDWRSAAKLKQYDDSSQPLSSQSRCQRTPYGNIYR